MEGLTASALCCSHHPVILHVRQPYLRSDYSHWILFLGVEGDKARIINPPHALALLPVADLLALWDGVGLVVAKEPVSAWSFRAAGWLDQGLFLVFGVMVLTAARLGSRRFRLMQRPWVVLPSLLLLAVGMAVTSDCLREEGMLSNDAAVAIVAGQHFAPAVPALSVADVKSMLDQPGVTVIDARFPDAYADGHLPGAVNLPVVAGLVQRGKTLAAIKPDERVIVYCQSESCSWGEMVASDLVLRGYGKVYVFSGGWNAWEEQGQRKPGQ